MGLEQLGASVRLERDVATALAAADEGAFDVLLSDLNLGPGGSSLELARRLHSMQRFAGLPAIAVSGERDVDDSSDAKFDAHLIKPVRVRELADVIAAVLHMRSH